MELNWDSRTRKELLELVDAVCADQSDEEGVRRLDELLVANPEAVRAYVRYREMHSILGQLTDSAAVEPQEADTSATPDDLSAPASRPTLGRPRWSRLGAVAAIAASMLFMIGGYTIGLYQGNDQDPPAAAAESGDQGLPIGVASQTTEVARVTGLIDCRWASTENTAFFGKSVNAGDVIDLSEGLVQLTFGHGAKVIVQGPAKFVPSSLMESSLEFGKLSAVVPEKARGFTVTTPTAQVVDLGTEFAVDVARNGATEVHVVKGDVIARRLAPDGALSGEAIHARRLDAVRFTSNDQAAERLAANPEKFVLQITPKLTRDQLPPLPVVHDLALWMAADLLVSRDESGRVSAWRDICIGDNQVAHDACQFTKEAQPLWVDDSKSGAPAIRFNGQTTALTTDPFVTGDRVSVFVAFRGATEGQNDTPQGGHLLNFGGVAPTIELNISSSDAARTRLWAANAVGVKVKAGLINDKKAPRDKPCVLSYSYDLVADCAEQWINGVSQGKDSAPLSARAFARRTIGAHGNLKKPLGFFRGDIYEVLIYNNALTDEEQNAVNNYLLDRYVRSLNTSTDAEQE